MLQKKWNFFSGFIIKKFQFPFNIICAKKKGKKKRKTKSKQNKVRYVYTICTIWYIPYSNKLETQKNKGFFSKGKEKA